MNNINSDLNLSQASVSGSVSVSTIVPCLEECDKHLETLGLLPEECRLRFIHPLKDGRDKVRKANYSHAAILEYQRQGYNCYLTPNIGGDKASDISACTSIFIEHDDLEKILQVGLWQTIGLLEPSIQVDTGGKSIHSYWRFEERLQPGEWLPLQAQLIKVADSDKACKDLSRVMRLAGSVYYCKKTGEPLGTAKIVSSAGGKYSYQAMLGAIQSCAIAPSSPSPAPSPAPAPQSSDTLTPVIDAIKLQTRIDDFNLYQHEFKQVGTEKWQGDCPWHDSTSKTAFYVNRSEGILKWRCPECEVGGTLFDYSYKIKHGRDAEPRKKDFVTLTAELAPRFNLSVEVKGKGKGKQGTASPDKLQASGDAKAKAKDGKGKIDDLDEIITPFCIKYPHLKYVKKYKSFYYFQGKFWEKKEDSEVENRVRQFIRQHNYKLTKSSSIADIVKVLKWDLSNSEIDNSTHYLGFQDGVLDLSDFRFYAHSPKFGNTFILPRNYLCESAQTPTIDRFLAELTNSNETQIQVILAFMAACLKRINKCQKFLHLLGSAGSGKGTFLRLIGELVGSTNSHSSSLAILENSQFESFNLIDKLLTVFPDEHKISGNLSRFLSLTGGDSIRCEEKYRESFSAPYRGMVAIASNFEVFVSDAMDAVARRRILISCNFKPTKVDPYLDERLKAELPALTKKLVAMSSDEIVDILMTRNINQHGNWESRIANNGVAAWMDSCIVFDPDSRVLVGRNKDELLTGDGFAQTLYGSYGAFCRGAGYQVRSLNNFSQDVIATARTFWDCQVHKGRGKQGIYLEGVRLASPGGGLGNAGYTENAESPPKSQWCSPEVKAKCSLGVDLKTLHRKDSVSGVDLTQKVDSNLKNDVARDTSHTMSTTSPPGDAKNQPDTQVTSIPDDIEIKNETEFSGKVYTSTPVLLDNDFGLHPSLHPRSTPPKKEVLPWIHFIDFDMATDDIDDIDDIDWIDVDFWHSCQKTRLLADTAHLGGVGSRVSYKNKLGTIAQLTTDENGQMRTFSVVWDDGSELFPYPGECEVLWEDWM